MSSAANELLFASFWRRCGFRSGQAALLSKAFGGMMLGYE